MSPRTSHHPVSLFFFSQRKNLQDVGNRPIRRLPIPFQRVDTDLSRRRNVRVKDLRQQIPGVKIRIWVEVKFWTCLNVRTFCFFELSNFFELFRKILNAAFSEKYLLSKIMHFGKIPKRFSQNLANLAKIIQQMSNKFHKILEKISNFFSDLQRKIWN